MHYDCKRYVSACKTNPFKIAFDDDDDDDLFRAPEYPVQQMKHNEMKQAHIRGKKTGR